MGDLYSYSFAQRSDWSRPCSPQDEILRYASQVASEYGIERLVEWNTEVVACAWDCDSSYRDERGRLITNWPGYMRQYAAALRTLDPAEFAFVPLPDRTTVSA